MTSALTAIHLAPQKKHKKGVRIATVLLSSVAAFTLLAGCSTSTSSHTQATSASAAPNLDLITPGTINAATQSDQYPFAFDNTNGKLEGFSIDLVNDIAQRLHLKVTYTTLSLDPLLSGITSGQYDTAAVGLSVTPARQATMNFTEPFYYGYDAILEKKGSHLEATASSLSGKTLAVVTGSAQIQYAQANFGGATLKEFPSQSSALAALLGGQVDAFFLGGPDTIKYLRQNPSLALAGTIETDKANAFPVPKQNTKLVAAMNRELNAMFADGTYTRIYKKWFTQPIPPALIASHPSLKANQ